MSSPPCPCGSGPPYAVCCEPLHDNRVQAATAERLMRSRYAAYAVGRLDHVLRTWHPRTRPHELTDPPGLTWTGLTVLATEDGQPGDEAGVVEFEAAYRDDESAGVQHERSRFARRAGRWFYLDGS
ncbi:YchJ family protein [Microlunatus lacustris]